MGKLSDEEKAAFEKLKAKLDAPDEPEPSREQRALYTNVTIDLDNEAQVKRAVRAGLLPASYLEDDEEDDTDDDGKGGNGDPDDAPRRTLDRRYS